IEELKAIPYFRDVQLAQSIKYPSYDINIDRVRAAQLGIDLAEVTRSLIAATSSSRYTEKNTWIDEKAGLSYNVQVQVPIDKMKDEKEIGEIPLLKNSSRPILSDIATITPSFTYGENDNLGAMPYISVTANIDHTEFKTASKDVQLSIKVLGKIISCCSMKQLG